MIEEVCLELDSSAESADLSLQLYLLPISMPFTVPPFPTEYHSLSCQQHSLTSLGFLLPCRPVQYSAQTLAKPGISATAHIAVKVCRRILNASLHYRSACRLLLLWSSVVISL